MSGRKRAWTDEQLLEAVKVSRSVAEVIRALGLRQGGGTHQHIKYQMRALGVELTNHDPWAWMKDPLANTGGREMPLDEALTCPSPYFNTAKLRQRLLRAGLKQNQCEVCGLSDWRGQHLTMQLDHVDGNRANNTLENLRMLCPNCHAQTDTWCKHKTKPPT